jgi:hypothetical protein
LNSVHQGAPEENQEQEMMIFMDLRQCDESRKNIELDHSLTILRQSIRSLRSEELTNSLKIDETDPHVLCFSEHHMVEQDLFINYLVIL